MSQCAANSAFIFRREVGRTLYLDLVGPLRLHHAGGRELTPRSRKAQGMLALIGTSPHLRRSRSWLQDKLWSDRDPEHGAGSLRKTLSNIRSALGEHVACLQTETGWVGLDPARVSVRTEPPAVKLEAETEFLEGLEIRDPEFENWIRNQRTYYSEQTRQEVKEFANHPADGAPFRGVGADPWPTVALDVVDPEPASQRLFCCFLLDLLARSLLGRGVAVKNLQARCDHVLRFPPQARPELLLQVAEAVRGHRVRLTLRLSKFEGVEMLWTDVATFDAAEFWGSEQTRLIAFAARTACSVRNNAFAPERSSRQDETASAGGANS